MDVLEGKVAVHIGSGANGGASNGNRSAEDPFTVGFVDDFAFYCASNRLRRKKEAAMMPSGKTLKGQNEKPEHVLFS